jgi:hypothetical protein
MPRICTRPRLVKLHTGAVDRMHSEVFDSLVSTGGLAPCDAVPVRGGFYVALRYLGFLRRPHNGSSVSCAAGCVAGLMLPWAFGS